jgi:preprotein translocase subunit SecB
MTDLFPGAAPGGAQQAPITLNVLAQYLKDMSFENPNTTEFMTKPPQSQPQFDLKINVNTRQVQMDDYEVELLIEAKATAEGRSMFLAEITYAGIFRVGGVPRDSLGPVLMIECPRLLFPFVRHILAEATQNGGYAPLLLPPIDFVGLYQQRMQSGGGDGLAQGTA